MIENKISYFEQNATGLLVVFVTVYALFFILWHLYAVNVVHMSILNTLFTSPLTVFTILFSSTLALTNMGKITAQDNVEFAKQRCLREIRNKEQSLVDYVLLAKILTKNDANDLVDDYLNKLEKSI